MASRASQHRTILRALCLGVPLAMACQMTSGDEVPRSPPLVHASGGSGGRDVAVVDEPVSDIPTAPDTTEDALSLDQTTRGYDAGIDTGASVESCGGDSACAATD
jgi:hypothetical protein